MMSVTAVLKQLSLEWKLSHIYVTVRFKIKFDVSNVYITKYVILPLMKMSFPTVVTTF